jgi:hypothetical protein
MAAARRASVSVLAAVAVAWAWLLVAAPALAQGGPGTGAAGVAAAVRAAAAPFCHQRAERSFAFDGRPFPVCGRCLALYLSGAAGLAVVAALAWMRPEAAARPVAPLWRSRRLTTEATWLAAAAVPTAVVAVVEWTLVDPGNVARALAALPLGAGVGAVCGLGLTRRNA